MADATPLHKKGKKDLKNYRAVSILPIFSKVFERNMFAQMSNFFDKFLSKQQGGFQKGYSIQGYSMSFGFIRKMETGR